MNSFKIKNLPIFILLALSFMASLLMGCSGGGGGAGPGGGSSEVPAGYAPLALTAGMVFEFNGSYEYHPTDKLTYVGKVQKELSMTSPTSGTSTSSAYEGFFGGYSTGTSSIDYVRSNGNVVRITATNYPYNTDTVTVTRGSMQIRLSFTSATGGTFVEIGQDDGVAYGSGGEFIFTDPAAAATTTTTL